MPKKASRINIARCGNSPTLTTPTAFVGTKPLPGFGHVSLVRQPPGLFSRWHSRRRWAAIAPIWAASPLWEQGIDWYETHIGTRAEFVCFSPHHTAVSRIAHCAVSCGWHEMGNIWKGIFRPDSVFQLFQIQLGCVDYFRPGTSTGSV